MSSAQAISVPTNLLQLLSSEAAAFGGLAMDSPGSGGLFSQALLNSISQQSASASGQSASTQGGLGLPSGGEALPPQLEGLVRFLHQGQQTEGGADISADALSAAGIDLESLGEAEVEVAGLLLAAAQQDGKGKEQLADSLQQLRQLILDNRAGKGDGDSLSVRPELSEDESPEQLFLRQNNDSALRGGSPGSSNEGQSAQSAAGAVSLDEGERGLVPQEEELAKAVDARALRPGESGVDAGTQPRQNPIASQTTDAESSINADSAALLRGQVPGDGEAGETKGGDRNTQSQAVDGREQALSSQQRAEVAQDNRQQAEVAAAKNTAIDLDAERQGEARNGAAEVPPGRPELNAQKRAESSSSGSSEAAVTVRADGSNSAVPTSQVPPSPQPIKDQEVRPDTVVAQSRPQPQAQASESVAAKPIDPATRVAPQADAGQSTSNSGGGGSSENPRDFNRQENFRQSLESIRAELGGAPKNVEGERVGNTGFSASLAAAQGQDASNRLPPGLSSFQQVQYAYKGDVGSEINLNLPERFGSERWTPGLSQRLIWMSNQQIGRAELRLDPPDLGSLNIRLSIHNDQASLSFTSPNAQVRDLLEQQMPRLREMLSENGIELQHSDVSDQAPSQQSERERFAAEEGGSALSDQAEADEELVVGAANQAGSMALVDYYA